MVRKPLRRFAGAVVAGLGIVSALSLVTAAPAYASITSPSNGSTVRGMVGISESGASNHWACGGESSTVQVLSGTTVIFSQTKSSPGSWSTTWNTSGRPNGKYIIKSIVNNRKLEWNGCKDSFATTQIGVTLSNRSFLTFTSAPTSGYHLEGASFTARLTNEFGTVLNGKTVTFSLAGQGTQNDATSSGLASTTFTLSRNAGSSSIVASYGGSTTETASATPTNGFTVLARPTALANSGALSALANTSFTAGARLFDVRSGANLGGRALSLALKNGSSVISSGSGTTNGGGVATKSLDAAAPAGSYSLVASFGGETNYLAAPALSSPFTIGLRPSVLTHTGEPTVLRRETLAVTVALTDGISSAALPNENVQFTVTDSTGASVLEHVGVTDGDGKASFEAGDLPAGTYTITESFGGNSYNGAVQTSSTFEVVRRILSLSVAAADTAFSGEAVDVVLAATDGPTGSIEADHAVAVELLDANGDVAVASIEGVTDETGSATITVPVDLLAGTYTIRASSPETADHLASTADGVGVEVLERPTTLTYSGATAGTRGSTVTLSAVLTDTRNGSPLADRPVQFSLGSFTADAVTDAAGVATVDVVLDQDPGSYEVETGFAGDAGYFVGTTSTTPFVLGWEHAFESATGSGTIFLNPSTKEFQFIAGDDDTGIVSDPGMTVQALPGVGTLVAIAYTGEGLSVIGEFDLGTGIFTALVVTETGQYALAGPA